MAEYIKREDVLDALCNASVPTFNLFGKPILDVNYVPAINAIPAADVRPVVRGEWIGYPECLKYTNAYSDDHIVCSACEECFSILDNDCERFNFCPNCGADMREENDGT